MYHYFYKITNTINNHFYYGIHSTNNLDDGYMGSGRRLKRAINKYGIENFVKEIIKFFDSREDCAKYESEIVNNDLVCDNTCYNISLGGEQLCCKNTWVVFDNILQQYVRIPMNSELSDRYSILNSNMMIAYDVINNKYVRIPKESFDGKQYINARPFPKNSIFVYRKDDINKKIFMINKNEFDENIYCIAKNHFQKENVLVKDNNNNIFFTNITDERYISGELKHISVGYKFTDEQKQKLKNKFKEIKHQQGEKNSQFGTKWISKDGITKKIKKEDVEKYISEGWHLGMK